MGRDARPSRTCVLCRSRRLPLRRAPGRNRIDIEGMAAANGRLFFALRGPNVEGNAYVVSVDARALFEGGDLSDPLSQWFGWAPIKAFVISQSRTAWLSRLLDPATLKSPADYSIVELHGLTTGMTVQPKELATLDLQDAPLREEGSLIKPEAIAVLELSPRRYRLLVLSDGGDDGAPLVFNIPRKP